MTGSFPSTHRKCSRASAISSTSSQSCRAAGWAHPQHGVCRQKIWRSLLLSSIHARARSHTQRAQPPSCCQRKLRRNLQSSRNRAHKKSERNIHYQKPTLFIHTNTLSGLRNVPGSKGLLGQGTRQASKSGEAITLLLLLLLVLVGCVEGKRRTIMMAALWPRHGHFPEALQVVHLPACLDVFHLFSVHNFTFCCIEKCSKENRLMNWRFANASCYPTCHTLPCRLLPVWQQQRQRATQPKCRRQDNLYFFYVTRSRVHSAKETNH